MADDPYQNDREEMVVVIAAIVARLADRLGRGELDSRVLRAMLRVPRHHFVPVEVISYAYADSPLPIGFGKTISQPFMVALMADLLAPRESDRVLEVGTGLGYQSAILSQLAGHVCSIEIVEELAVEAKRKLAETGCENVETRTGDGARGWPERAPFDSILVAAAPEMIPPLLLHQLRPGGRMVLPAGPTDHQILMLVEKDADGHLHSREILPVRFVPLESEDDEFDDGAPTALA
ncbi:MAG: protein-L-isoaspartate(D-aspartate) O-methyltransferase [Alphaproteobacteria bacterium]|nr:protein-L-isoaspartate(D-aspartate) O-methyltransferase [Alphaproteobacteria bacterium]MDP6564366.1 protein-L-isoaspartate(D-aspartate) O-methyltransferase [Alphaproteobacteria bacterium]MDP6812536.1 protein-L-isoaspartate(D-aspartate) O-methyltransferase [Alphaproteobacteria bacterium]